MVFHRQFAGAKKGASCRKYRLATLSTATQRDYPFVIHAAVVLPDHIHALWQLPPNDPDFSTWWRLIKTRFAKALSKEEHIDDVRRARGERGIWQRRFWEHLIRDESDYIRHIEYCYFNPLKHGLATRVQDWPYSSFHRDVQRGIFPIDWAGDINIDGEFGEAA